MPPKFPDDVFELAGRLALASHHPVAAAVARAAEAKTPLAGVEEVAGQGVRGFVDGVEVRLGQAVILRRGAAGQRDPVLGIPKLRSSLSATAKKFMSLRCGSGCVRMRQAVIAALQARGIAVEILSGDREPAVRARRAVRWASSNGAPA